MLDKEVIATFLGVTLVGSILYMFYWLFTPWRDKGFLVGIVVAAGLAGIVSGIMFGDTMPKLIARIIATPFGALIGFASANVIRRLIHSFRREKPKRQEEQYVLGDDGEIVKVKSKVREEPW